MDEVLRGCSSPSSPRLRSAAALSRLLLVSQSHLLLALVLRPPDTNTSLSQLLLLVKCDGIGHFFSQNALTVSNAKDTDYDLRACV